MSTTTRAFRCGLIGNDLGTSLSPVIHETEAAALGLEGFRYEAIDLEGQENPDLGAVLKDALSLGFTGFNVTHPHKQAIMPFLSSVAPDAAALGAVNTITIENGELVGHNTDRSGFLAGLRRTLPSDAAHESVVLFGAGGAGSAVASALLDFGVTTLRIIDTVPERLEQLRGLLLASVEEASNGESPVRIEIGEPEHAQAWIRDADGVVNATPIGMEHIPGTPFITDFLHGDQWVADVIYRPANTQLLQDAQSKGCVVVNGTTMLIEQAADTFVLLTGISPDRDRMRQHLATLLASPSAS